MQCDDLQVHRRRRPTELDELRTCTAFDRHPSREHALTRLDNARRDVEEQAVRFDRQVDGARYDADEAGQADRRRAGIEASLQRPSEELLG